jgi:hypothetical protein
VQQEGHSVGAAARNFQAVQHVFRQTWEVLHAGLKAWESSSLMPTLEPAITRIGGTRTQSLNEPPTTSLLLGESLNLCDQCVARWVQPESLHFQLECTGP